MEGKCIVLTVYAFMPSLLIVIFSSSSKSLRPIYTISDGLMTGMNQLKPGKDEQLSTSPVKKATGIPCILPDKDFAGVLISACASTYSGMVRLLLLVTHCGGDKSHWRYPYKW